MAIINGTAGNDSLTGTSSNDTIRGLGGNDTIRGGAGNDTIYGAAGNDVLIGGAGADIMYGGTGGDTFRFLSVQDSPSGGGFDHLKNFGSQGDHIDLSAIDADVYAAGDQAFTIGDGTGEGRVWTIHRADGLHVVANVRGGPVLEIALDDFGGALLDDQFIL